MTEPPNEDGRFPWEMTVEELLEEANEARRVQREAELAAQRHREREGRVASPDLVTQLIGPSDLRRMTPVTFFRALPGLWERFKPVARRWWRRAENRGAAVVRCPCGEHPEVRVGSTQACTCERVYFFDGSRLHVANSPQEQPANSS